jgi:hypothetical protein
VFGCKCFILKQGNFDKFESRSSDSIFLGYATHSHTYRVLNLETNRVVEACEVTFDKSMPCSVPVFECTCDQEISESIFVYENEEDADWGDAKPTSSTTTSAHGPDPSSFTTWGPHKPPPQPAPAAPEEAPAAVEGEATSSREAPLHIQRDRRHRSVGHAVQVTSDFTLRSLCFRSFFRASRYWTRTI